LPPSSGGCAGGIATIGECSETDERDSLSMIVGLGNPGKEYSSDRHNIGFRVVEALARAHGLTFRRRPGAKAAVASGQIGGKRVLVAKPQAFMNLSGQPVGSLSRFYKVEPERILVVYDDLDLPLGRLRLRSEGGSGGHKGMRSIIDALGSQAFPRLRVGISRPPGRMDPADFVLEPFDKAEGPIVAQAVDEAVAAIECWLQAGIVAAMDRTNRPLAAEGAEERKGQAGKPVPRSEEAAE
jgi:PTH1 family peptidyl-tRNA hydrolase